MAKYSLCSECGCRIPMGHHMCEDCYMWMRGISPGPQGLGEKAREGICGPT